MPIQEILTTAGPVHKKTQNQKKFKSDKEISTSTVNTIIHSLKFFVTTQEVVGICRPRAAGVAYTHHFLSSCNFSMVKF
jgi:hypothetical protein